MKTLDPIFIHASPRSGSTYFFNVLRRNLELMCFNEAISDVYHLPKQKLRFDPHHDFLDRDDLVELKAAWGNDIIPPPYPTFHNYRGLTGELEVYINRLITHAKSYGKRPVFCEIYSRYRARTLREKFGGFHVTQVRDFKPQFGSFVRALVEGGEWGFLALPYLEAGYSGIDSIDLASEVKISYLQQVHRHTMLAANNAAQKESDLWFNIDIQPNSIGDELGMKLDFSNYKKYPQYPIPAESEWCEIIRKRRPSFKIAVSKLPFARRLYGKLSQLRQTA